MEGGSLRRKTGKAVTFDEGLRPLNLMRSQEKPEIRKGSRQKSCKIFVALLVIGGVSLSGKGMMIRSGHGYI